MYVHTYVCTYVHMHLIIVIVIMYLDYEFIQFVLPTYQVCVIFYVNYVITSNSTVKVSWQKRQRAHLHKRMFKSQLSVRLSLDDGRLHSVFNPNVLVN